MKKIIAVLAVLAMVLTMVPAVFATESEGVIIKQGTESITDTGYIEFYYKAVADGILTLTLSADTGYKFWVYEAATDASLGLPEDGAAGTYEYGLKSGAKYRIYIIGYKNWGESAATITYEASFKAEQLEIPPVDIDKSDVALELGANTVNLLENTIVSLYPFTPSEPGVYTITATGADIATYGFAAWNLIAEGENGVVEHTATDAEQTILIGLTAETAAVTVTVEKTGSYTPPEQIAYEDYVPTNILVTDFEEPTDLVNIDINKEQNVVLGSDGYYHLGTAAGPVVYANLNTNQFTLAILFSAGAPTTLRGVYVDEEGQEHHYDFMSMISAQGSYYEFSREYDYHPLNKDLMVFLKAYGGSQGWYNPGTSSFAAIQSGEFVEESAWLASCYSTAAYVEPGTQEEPTPEETIPAETTPAETTPAETTPAETTPAETTPAEITPAETTPAETEAETKVEIATGGITQVPESLKNSELDTVEKIKEALVNAITDKNEKINDKNIAHYDVTLMYTEDGTTWIKADETHFPENGKIKVAIEYPEGTDSTHDFTVVHMFTSSAFGKKVGDVEYPEVTKTETGIEFEVTGLSPITVGWTAPETKAETPETGDNSTLVLMFIMMLVSACGMVVVASKKHAR